MSELDPNAPRVVDVVIIGGGPAGASAAIYTARADLTTVVIDKGLSVGALGITEKISNYPGVPGPISGSELLATIRKQAESFGAEFVTDRVVAASFSSELHSIVTNGGSFEARAVIVATGSMGRASTVVGEERLLGKGVSYCATCDGAFFRGRPVAVVGNHDEAIEEALFLTRFASEVHFLVPTTAFKARAELIAAIEAARNVTLVFGARLQSINGEETVTSVTYSTPERRDQNLPVEGVFIYLQGTRPITDFLLDQLELTDKGCIRVDPHMHASVPGVFAVGDLVCSHPKQAVIAAADGVVAALSAERYLRGRSRDRVDWGG